MEGRVHREKALRSYYEGEVRRRAARELDPERVSGRERFIGLVVARGRRRLLEIGRGPGRDGVHFARAGLDYVGVDLAPKAVAHCRRLGLRAEQASVLDLPFDDASFDAGWTMSTLVHVAGEDLAAALAELARVLEPGAPLAVGLWGGAAREGLHGARFFAIRPDDEVRRALEAVGAIEEFATWPHPDDASLHYQLVRVRVGG